MDFLLREALLDGRHHAAERVDLVKVFVAGALGIERELFDEV